MLPNPLGESPLTLFVISEHKYGRYLMKADMNLLGQSLRVSYMILISIFYFSGVAFALKPIGKLGEPLVDQHAFLSNETILRVLYSHIEVVDADTGVVIDTFGDRNYVSEVILSPTASHLAILNYSSDLKTTTVDIWDTHARQQTSQWEMAGPVRLAAFSRIGSLFAVSFADEITLHNYQTGTFIAKMRGDRRPWEQCHTDRDGSRGCSSRRNDHALVFTPDNRYLIVASERPDVELWNVETHRLEAHFEGHTGNWVADAVISPDGRRLATFEDGWNDIYVWDVETQQLLWKEKSGIGSISGVVFSPDSQHLYVGTQATWLSRSGAEPVEGFDDQVRVWQVETGKQVDLFSGGDFDKLETIRLSANGRKMLLAYWDAVLLWDIDKRQPLKVWADFITGWQHAMSANGKTFVALSWYCIKAWDVASQKLRFIASAEGRLFDEFAVSPDGEKIAIGQVPWIEVHNLQTGTIEHRFQHYYGDGDIAFSSTGRWVATRGYKKIDLLDLENPEKGQMLALEAGRDINYSTKFSFSDNDEYLAATTQTRINNKRLNSVILFKRHKDTFNFQYAWQLPEGDNVSRPTMAQEPDGSPLLAVSIGNQTQIFKLLNDSSELLNTLDTGAPIRFIADGRFLFANREASLQIFDRQTQTPMLYPAIYDYLDVSRDGSVLLSHTDTGQLNIWDAKALLPSQLGAVYPQGKGITQLGAVKQNQLLQNFPNPFNPETWIPFRLVADNDVSIDIYTPTGVLVRRLSLGRLPSGEYTSPAKAVYWDGRNQTGEPVSSGIYLYTINAGDFSATRKMLIRK